jgi:hypothetical protein
MSTDNDKQSKDTEMYRKVIKSQNCNHTEICEVIKLLVNDTIICKPLSKHFIWYLKNNDDTYKQALDIEIRQLIFPKLIQVYNRTIKHLLDNVCNDDYELVKPHYVVLARKLILISNRLNQLNFKNSLFRELPYVLYNS